MKDKKWHQFDLEVTNSKLVFKSETMFLKVRHLLMKIKQLSQIAQKNLILKCLNDLGGYYPMLYKELKQLATPF
jgi:hypothetical protein